MFPTSATGGFRFTTSTFTGNLDNVSIVEISSPATILLSGQDDGSTTLYNSFRMPNETSFSVGGGGSIISGAGNNFLGTQAGQNNTTGSYNNFFGEQAGYNNTTGVFNNFFGFLAGFQNTTGNNNNFFGNQAGSQNTIGNANNFFGTQAGLQNTTGGNNNFFGFFTGRQNTSGSFNNFIGYFAGSQNTTGGNNNFIGSSAGSSNTTGNSNNFIGNSAGFQNTTGSENVAIGVDAGRQIAAGSNNTIMNSSIYIGNGTRANANDQTNQIVIGHNAIGLGSNTAQLGNTSIAQVGLGNIKFKTSPALGAGDDGKILTYVHANGQFEAITPVGDNLGNHIATTNIAMAQFDINNANKITSDTVATTNITNLSKVESPTGGTAKSRIIMGTALSIPTAIRTENSSNSSQYGQLAVDADGITSLVQVNGLQEAGLKIEADSIVSLYTTGNNSITLIGDTARVVINNTTAIKVGSTGKVEIKDYVLTETSSSPAQAEKFAILPVDCTGGAKTVTPPASPVAGDWFAVSDSRANAGTNNITVDTSGDKLHGAANDYIMNANADFVKFVYVNATVGWIRAN